MARLLADARIRTALGALAALLFVPVLLGISACLETPVGDPEKGWVDPRLSGIWLTGDQPPRDHVAQLWVLEPFDSRTWLLTCVEFEKAAETAAATAPPNPDEPTSTAAADPEEPPLQPQEVLRILKSLSDEEAVYGSISVFKVWLTTIKGKRFMTFEPHAVPTSKRGFRPGYWFVVRAELRDDRLQLRLLDRDVEDLGLVASRGLAEQIIARHADDPAFYEDEVLALYRLPRAAYDDVAAALVNIGVSH